MENLIKAISVAIGLATFLGSQPNDTGNDKSPAVELVADWKSSVPAVGWKKPTDSSEPEVVKTLPTPEPPEHIAKPIPDPETDAVSNVGSTDAKDSAAGMGSFIPKPSKKSGWKEVQLTEQDVRRIAREEAAKEYEVQKRVDTMQAQRYASQANATSMGSNGGSSGGNATNGVRVSYPVATAPMASSPVFEVPTPTPVPASVPATERRIDSTREYLAANGCTVRETTYSDGTKSSEVIRCPVQRKRPLQQFFNR